MQFKKILLPIDINDEDSWKKTLPTCVSMIEKSSDCKLYILSVIPNFGMSMVEEYFPAGWMKEISDKTKLELDKIITKYVPKKIAPEVIIGKGVVYQAVIEHSVKLEIDLIVMAASHSASKEYLLGPNVAKVARHAEVSVLICR